MSQKSQVVTIIASSGAVIIASMLAIFLTSKAAINANANLILRHQVIGQLQATLSTVKDAENGARGYLLTGDEQYLQPYDQAVGRIGQELESLAAAARAEELSA